ncbi:MAG TPA: bifunctional demethylmenaquinone methyltransferase/2-methoxy-6-polyprenyl-1,4-benzoquinol methylase UbiE [Bryobacteraceae bacterium]|jgi:demethylmenaquinone methyltransferase/2-methoxy-6-polyprenyl-1,4-benzoquinol methylase
MSGTTPQGITDERQASAWVRGMFGSIAGRYDLLNHVLSFNLDRLWRARTVREVAPLLGRPEARVLDLCCGTGDLMLALEHRRGAPVIGADFCHPMLVEARRKVRARAMQSTLFEGDAMSLPLASDSFDLITCAFGFRNFANYESGLVELRRVLKPGGTIAILEFSQPGNRLFAALYDWFSLKMLPRIGGLISGSREAYSYLPQSIRKFPDAPGLAAKMEEAGFDGVKIVRMTFGTVALHTGRKS